MALVYNNGEVDNKTIANTLEVDMRTNQRTRKKLEESKDLRGVVTRALKFLDDHQKSRDADFVKRVEAMIDINPSKSMRSMAVELGVDKRTNRYRQGFALQKLQNANWPAFDPGDQGQKAA